ncbi:ParB/RepB/Spo0J family partition protein [Allomesorhizobium camelthorni]|uniref:ParB/RepB/Spo0J family partition protein n=1 Tax=Allomesorhizobium camelthorni TaxID=475069 RepID=UPI001FE77608|nr:chromosome partitioning protein ParB [Mesorhizobium camelthorni]
MTIADEGQSVEPLPCAIMEPGDDAAALEASLIENIARLDPDEVSQWETFTRLLKAGRTVADIAATFGITEIMVKRRLALGNLLPAIRNAYRRDEIDAESVRYLTLANKERQKEWLALFNNPDTYAPHRGQLKAWLLGGQTISTKAALFPLDTYAGQIVADLFGEESYFEDADTFWRAQNEAIAGRKAAYLEAGWSDVIVLDANRYFHSWEYEKTPKKKGGKVFIAVSRQGDVAFHEGYLTTKEARRARSKQDGGDEDSAAPKPSRPEVTSAMQTYIDLHRHAAVRSVLADHLGVALRLMVAHAIAGSPLWSVKPEPQRAGSEAIAASLAGCAAQAAFAEKRREVLALLGQSGEEETVSGGNGDDFWTASVFARLLALCDDDVLRVLSVVMAETMQAGSAIVEALGMHLNVDMGAVWQPDGTFFDLIRDKEVANAMLADIAGTQVAAANISEKVKTQKQIVRDFSEGTNGRTKVENWLPAWMAFPARAYTERGGFRNAEQWAKVAPLFAPPAAE